MGIDAVASAVWTAPTRTLAAGSPPPPSTTLDLIAEAVWTAVSRTTGTSPFWNKTPWWNGQRYETAPGITTDGLEYWANGSPLVIPASVAPPPTTSTLTVRSTTSWADLLTLFPAGSGAWAEMARLGSGLNASWAETAWLLASLRQAWLVTLDAGRQGDALSWFDVGRVLAPGISQWRSLAVERESRWGAGAAYGWAARNPVSRHPMNRGLIGWWLPLRGRSGGASMWSLRPGTTAPAGLTIQAGSLSAPPSWSSGPNGFASARLAGTGDMIVVPHAAAMNSPHITASCWFCLDAAPASNGYHSLLVKASGSTWAAPFAAWALRVERSARTNNVARLVAWVNDGADPACFAIGGSEVTAGEWHHAAVSYDGNALTVYLDGVREGVCTPAVPLATSSFGLHLGCRPGGSDNLRGRITDVRLASVCLSGAEVRADYRDALQGRPRTIRWLKPRVSDAPLLATVSLLGSWHEWARASGAGLPAGWWEQARLGATTATTWPIAGRTGPRQAARWYDLVPTAIARLGLDWADGIRVLMADQGQWNLRQAVQAGIGSEWPLRALLLPAGNVRWFDLLAMDIGRQRLGWSDWLREIDHLALDWPVRQLATARPGGSWSLRGRVSPSPDIRWADWLAFLSSTPAAWFDLLRRPDSIALDWQRLLRVSAGDVGTWLLAQPILSVYEIEARIRRHVAIRLPV